MNKLLSLLLLTILTGCGAGNRAHDAATSLQPADWNETTRIEYRYGDSSLPPDYHRSYDVAFTDSTITLSIDSYGTVLLTRQYTNTPSAFRAFKDELASQDIKQYDDDVPSACDGGTSETLRLFKGGDKYFDAYVYHCDGESGTLHMPDGATRLILNQLPENIDSLVSSTTWD